LAKTALPEVKESDAVGEISALYDDIRAVIGAPIVNLVFRNMATIPGCLLWAWGTVRPLYINGEIPKAARALTAAVMPGHHADLSQPIKAASLSLTDLAEIDRVLDTYGRANPMNLIGLKVIDLALAGTPQEPGVRRIPALNKRSLLKPEGLRGLLPMTDPLNAPAGTRGALNKLARQIHGGDTGVIPSLYRHFGGWPIFLKFLEPALEPLLRGGAFEASAQHMLSDSEAYAKSFHKTLPLQDMAAPGPEAVAALKMLSQQFPPNICRMTVLAILIRRNPAVS
jgi:hypothetical protein